MEQQEKRDFEELREMAEETFLARGMTAREIAFILGISEMTISKWRKGRDGRGRDEKKNKLQLMPLLIKENLFREAPKIAGSEKFPVDAGGFSKIMSAVDKLNKKTVCQDNGRCIHRVP